MSLRTKKLPKQLSKLLPLLFIIIIGLTLKICAHTKEPLILNSDKEAILSMTSEDVGSYDAVKWDNFSSAGYDNDVTDGVIPKDLLSDPIFCSMNLPSEAMSDFATICNRGNGHIISLLTPKQTHALSIGAVYLESDKTMSSDFTICVGKMSLFAYSVSQNRWVIVDECPYPTALTMYQLPWSMKYNYACEDVKYFYDHAEVHLKADQINGFAFHFWGHLSPINQSDYKYYASAYDIWVKEKSAENILTTEGGIDAKDQNSGNGIQLLSSRSISLTTSPKTCWCHTIPNSEYNRNRDGDQLLSLFNN